MEKHRVTLRDIARECGVHFTTVSRALAHHTSIPSETCERIQQKAKEMGYVPDPMLSALSAYRTKIRPRSYQGNLAWVTNYSGPKDWAKHEIYKLHFEGAVERANELGYRLEEFWLGEPEMNDVRAAQILRARNIRGLLWCAQPSTGVRLDFNWSRFSSVTFGYSLVQPALHTVAGHTFHAMVTTIEQVRRLGYSRLGLAIALASDERIFNIWSGAFLTQQQYWPRNERISLYTPTQFNQERFLKWVRRYEPDVVIAQDEGLIEVLEQAGIRVPKDIGFATPSLISHPRNPSGIDENPRLMGVAAVDMLSSMLQRNETGVPESPYYLLVKGRWCPGNTLVKKRTPKAKLTKTKRSR